MKQNLTATNDSYDASRENQFLQFDKIPWVFQKLIPTQLEVDGIKFRLQQHIDLNEMAKSYGHYRLRLVFLRFIKTKFTVIDTKLTSKLLVFNFHNSNWFYYLISFSAVSYLLFSKNHSGIILLIKIGLFILFILHDLVKNFVRIGERYDVRGM